MEDLEDNTSSSGLEPLFIKEEDADPDRTLMEQTQRTTAQSGFTFPGTQINPSCLIKPYLQEMDDLLKSCEERTGLSFGSHISETNSTEIMQCHRKDKVSVESYSETSVSPEAYFSTSYIDTNMDGPDTDDQSAQGHTQGLGTIINKCEVTANASCQSEMPLTLSGNKLSDSMMQYEGQLLGMLAMLESCMEETGMDFEPQDWTTDSSQEYVHITKNSNLGQGTTLVPIQDRRQIQLETHPMQLESCDSQQTWGDKLSQVKCNELTESSETIGSQQKAVIKSCDDLTGFSGTSLKCEAAMRRYMSTEEGTLTKGDSDAAIELDNTDFPAEDTQELQRDTLDLGSGINELGALGSQMEEYIKEVQQLERRRKELLAEVLELRSNKREDDTEENHDKETEEQIDSKVAELMNILKCEEEGRREERKKEIHSLRQERAEEEKRIWKVNLERQGLQDELRHLKRRLFAMARDCAQSIVALNTQQREVELLKREEEKLKELELQLIEEGTQLRASQQQRLLQLQEKLCAQSSNQPSSTQEELTQCRRNSCSDIQQYLQSGLKALESRYEPIMLTLLKRRELTAEVLVKAKEQAQELKAQLTPLKDEIQKLNLQRACLEEKLRLIYIHSREDVGQYKETVYTLEERSRELKAALKLEKRKNKELKELKDSLTNHLLLYRTATDDHNCEDEEKK